MRDAAVLVLMSFLGASLAALYLSALWFTVKRIQDARHPGLLLSVSLAARMMLVTAAFYLIVQGGHWERLLAALLGFVALRYLVTRRMGRAIDLPMEGKTPS